MVGLRREEFEAAAEDDDKGICEPGGEDAAAEPYIVRRELNMRYLRLLVVPMFGVLPIIGCAAPADNDRDLLQPALRDLAHPRAQECTDITIVRSAEEIKEFVDNCIVQRRPARRDRGLHR